jgi:hypothetical protein
MAAETLRIGDRYPWYEPPDALEQAKMIETTSRIVGTKPSRIERRLKNYIKRAGRPPDGNLEGVGWCKCPLCDADFFTGVTIRSDIVKEVVPDLFRFPLGPDTWFEAKGYCPRCGGNDDIEGRLFAGFKDGGRLKVRDGYLEEEHPRLSLRLRSLAVCSDKAMHEFVVQAVFKDGRFVGVEVDPDQDLESRSSAAHIFVPQ